MGVLELERSAGEPVWSRLPSIWLLGALLALLALVAAGPFIYPLRPQQASRYALTRAIAEEGTVVLDKYTNLLGSDKAFKDGHFYSDKAPGQPVFAVPFLKLARAVGVEPAHEARQMYSLDLWWVTFWSATVFGAGLLVMMHQRVKCEVADLWMVAPLALFFGSMLLPFSGILFGHVMAAFFLYAAFNVLTTRTSSRYLLLSGALAGASVCVEYTAAIGVLLLAVLATRRFGPRVVWWLAGGTLLAIPLGWYQHIAFGSPLRFSYQFTAFEGVVDRAQPLFHIFGEPSLENLAELFIGGRGLIVATPVLLCAVAGGLAQIRRRDADAWVGVAMFFAFLMIPIFWENPWGGASPGPRYMTPAIPFLVVPLAWAWKRWPILTRGAAAVSVLTMTSALVVQAMPYSGAPAGLPVWLRLLGMGLTSPTWFTVVFGWPMGWTIHGAIVVVVLVALAVLSSPRPMRMPEIQ